MRAAPPTRERASEQKCRPSGSATVIFAIRSKETGVLPRSTGSPAQCPRRLYGATKNATFRPTRPGRGRDVTERGDNPVTLLRIVDVCARCHRRRANTYVGGGRCLRLSNAPGRRRRSHTIALARPTRRKLSPLYACRSRATARVRSLGAGGPGRNNAHGEETDPTRSDPIPDNGARGRVSSRTAPTANDRSPATSANSPGRPETTRHVRDGDFPVLRGHAIGVAVARPPATTYGAPPPLFCAMTAIVSSPPYGRIIADAGRRAWVVHTESAKATVGFHQAREPASSLARARGD